MVRGKENGCKLLDTMLLLQVEVEMEGTEFFFMTQKTQTPGTSGKLAA